MQVTHASNTIYQFHVGSSLTQFVMQMDAIAGKASVLEFEGAGVETESSYHTTVAQPFVLLPLHKPLIQI